MLNSFEIRNKHAQSEKETESSRKYAERKEEDVTSESSVTKDIEPEVFLSRQTRFFDQVKLFLSAQQISLRQNLVLLEAKMTKLKETGRKLSEQSNNQSGIGDSKATNCLSEENLQIIQENMEMEALHQWGSPVEAKNDIQICPVCGMEIDNSENADALEDHVAAHWCSSEPI